MTSMVNLSVEQERTAFSDAEPVLRTRRKAPIRAPSRTKSLSTAPSLDTCSDDPSRPTSYRGDNEVDQDANNVNNDGTCPFEQNHQGKKLLHVVVPLPVDVLFALIFVQEQVMMNVYQMRNTTDVVNGPWQEENVTGQLGRQVTYAMSLNLANLGSKTSLVTEKQTLQHKEARQCYVVLTEAMNSGVPYADSFSIVNHYCLIRENDDRTRLTVWTLVKYKKTVWGVVKGLLEKNAYNGVEAFQAELLSQITLVAERGQRKGSKPAPAPVRSKTHMRNSSSGYKRQKASGKEGWKEPSSCNLWIILAMIIAFVMLISSNYFLYNKLHYLEMRSGHISSKPTTVKNFEGKPNVLQHYSAVQGEQMHTWKMTLAEASQSLQQVQESLEGMLNTIRNDEEALMSFLNEFARRNPNAKHQIHEEDVPPANENTSGASSTPSEA